MQDAEIDNGFHRTSSRPAFPPISDKPTLHQRSNAVDELCSLSGLSLSSVPFKPTGFSIPTGSRTPSGPTRPHTPTGPSVTTGSRFPSRPPTPKDSFIPTGPRIPSGPSRPTWPSLPSDPRPSIPTAPRIPMNPSLPPKASMSGDSSISGKVRLSSTMERAPSKPTPLSKSDRNSDTPAEQHSSDAFPLPPVSSRRYSTYLKDGPADEKTGDTLVEMYDLSEAVLEEQERGQKRVASEELENDLPKGDVIEKRKKQKRFPADEFFARDRLRKD